MKQSIITSQKRLDAAIDEGIMAVFLAKATTKPTDRITEMRIFLTAAIRYLEAYHQ